MPSEFECMHYEYIESYLAAYRSTISDASLRLPTSFASTKDLAEDAIEINKLSISSIIEKLVRYPREYK